MIKYHHLILSLTAGALVAVGCGKHEEHPVPTKTPEGQAAEQAPAPPAVTEPAQAAPKAPAEAAAGLVKEAQTAVETQVESVAAPATDQAQKLIDQAKTLLAEGKHAEAMDAIKGLSGEQLTAAQKQMVGDLQAQIQKAMAEKALPVEPKAIGNLLATPDK